jgi:hypothetical protein
MDRQYIENERIVERYLSGDLTVRELRELKHFCLTNPELLDEWGMPSIAKAHLLRRSEDIDSFETEAPAGTEALYGDPRAESRDSNLNAPRWRQRGKWVPALAFALVLALGALVSVVLYARNLSSKLQTTSRQAQSAGLQAHSSVQIYRLKLVRGRPQNPTLAVGWRVPPELLDLYIDVTEGNYSSFQVTIDRQDGSRVLQIKRIARDSNRELRLALNSSAFGPGIYLLKFDGYTFRGQTRELGWIMLGLE